MMLRDTEVLQSLIAIARARVPWLIREAGNHVQKTFDHSNEVVTPEYRCNYATPIISLACLLMTRIDKIAID